MRLRRIAVTQRRPSGANGRRQEHGSPLRAGAAGGADPGPNSPRDRRARNAFRTAASGEAIGPLPRARGTMAPPTDRQGGGERDIPASRGKGRGCGPCPPRAEAVAGSGQSREKAGGPGGSRACARKVPGEGNLPSGACSALQAGAPPPCRCLAPLPAAPPQLGANRFEPRRSLPVPADGTAPGPRGPRRCGGRNRPSLHRVRAVAAAAGRLPHAGLSGRRTCPPPPQVAREPERLAAAHRDIPAEGAGGAVGQRAAAAKERNIA